MFPLDCKYRLKFKYLSGKSIVKAIVKSCLWVLNIFNIWYNWKELLYC
jgi:hypothetical protein